MKKRSTYALWRTRARAEAATTTLLRRFAQANPHRSSCRPSWDDLVALALTKIHQYGRESLRVERWLAAFAA